MRRVVLLLVDGLRPDLAESMLDAGELPHLAELTRRGGRTRGSTAFPSTTTVAYLPFLTGASPGECNIPSIRWLDRTADAGRWCRQRGRIRRYCGCAAGGHEPDRPSPVQVSGAAGGKREGKLSPARRKILRRDTFIESYESRN